MIRLILVVAWFLAVMPPASAAPEVQTAEPSSPYRRLADLFTEGVGGQWSVPRMKAAMERNADVVDQMTDPELTSDPARTACESALDAWVRRTLGDAPSPTLVAGVAEVVRATGPAAGPKTWTRLQDLGAARVDIRADLFVRGVGTIAADVQTVFAELGKPAEREPTATGVRLGWPGLSLFLSDGREPELFAFGAPPTADPSQLRVTSVQILLSGPDAWTGKPAPLGLLLPTTPAAVRQALGTPSSEGLFSATWQTPNATLTLEERDLQAIRLRVAERNPATSETP